MVRVLAEIYRQDFVEHNGFTVVTENADLVATDDIEQALAALNDGKHVLMTQPATVAEAEALQDQDRVAVAQPHRCAPMVTAAARAIRAGKVGLPWNVQADCLTGMSVEDAIGVVDTLTGLRVLRAHAVPAGRTTLLSLDHEHGLTSTITAGDEPGDIHRYRISGSHGVLLVDATKPALKLSTKDTSWLANTALLDDLHRAITTSTKAAIGAEEALRTAKVAEAVTRSLASATPVDVS